MTMGRNRQRVRARYAGGAVSAPVSGLTATTFALAPSVHYHPNQQAGEVTKSGTRIVACPDIRGLAAASGYLVDGTTVMGPEEMTDGLGRKFWRFRGTDALFVANTLNAMNTRACGIFYVGRVHHQSSNNVIFSPRYLTYVSDSVNTTALPAQLALAARVVNNGAPSLQSALNTDLVNGYKVIPPCNLHVAGVASRTAALGGQRLYCQGEVVTTTQLGSNQTTMVGAVIGGVPVANNGVLFGNTFDLYELAYWKQTLTDAQADAISDAMMTNFALSAFDSQWIFEGGSTVDGIATTLPVSPYPGGNIGMQVTDPGTSYNPVNRRIMNNGLSGSQITGVAPNGTSTTVNLQARKNATTGIYGGAGTVGKYPGGPSKNIVSVMIARNDLAPGMNGNKNSADWYADYIDLLDNATAGSEGYLQRGFSVVSVGHTALPASATTTNNLPGETTLQKRLEGTRALVFDTGNTLLSSFLTDVQANIGQTYEGLVTGLALFRILQGGQSRFLTAADTTNTAAGYYDSDNTHHRVAGIAACLTGLDTPEYGYASLL